MPTNHHVAVRDLSFTYDSAHEPLIVGLSANFPRGFTGVIGANGGGKTTLLRLLVGDLEPNQGSVEGANNAVYCAQRTDDPPPGLNEFLNNWDSDAFELRGRLGINDDFLDRWPTLSHGERKRTQIGHALWQSPEVLAIDEPTNHLDQEARLLLIQALEKFRGVGLIVSHDRQLLDALCSQCIWLEPPAADVYSGGYSQAKALRATQRSSTIRTKRSLSTEQKRITKETINRRKHAEKSHQSRSKQGLARNDSDAREKIDRAKNTDSKEGQALNQLAGRTNQLQAKLAKLHVSKEYETGIWLPGSVSKRNLLLELAASSLQLAGTRVLHYPNFHLQPASRIAITGPNGSGKSTFIQHAITQINAPAEKVIYLPQELKATATQKLLSKVRTLPNEELGHIMNIVSRLNSRPERLLSSEQPSPGEARKLLLALGMSRSPHIIVMDEPTNHLDLPSIEALEAAFVECPCALLLISHDDQFLDNVRARRIELVIQPNNDTKMSDWSPVSPVT
ncbi:MAG: ATP-binding cassette domain-containing protein [Pseudomonadales bacterium]|nr:ATP-binding cassette domain-containing protein [Pseudomonadales bacterium]